MLAVSVFGPHLQLDDIQLKTAWWVLRHYAVSPNGNVFFHPDDWREDFSTASLGTQSWLIHELTHVWQLQQGMSVVRGALLNRRYEYALEAGKSFFAYGIEQQARMVQDYFIRLNRGEDCQRWQACIPFLHESGLPTQRSDSVYSVNVNSAATRKVESTHNLASGDSKSDDSVG